MSAIQICRSMFIILFSVFVIGVSADKKCTALSGKCQQDSLACAGGFYKSNLCSGSSNRRCCLSNDYKCKAKSGVCQYNNKTCEQYQSGLCSGPANRQCCLEAATSGNGADNKCTALSGKCQQDSLTCAGGFYRSNLCSGSSNRRCCLSNDYKCKAKSGVCQYNNKTCEQYQSGLCSGPANRQCCLEAATSGNGGVCVNYRGFSVSDAVVKQKLREISELFGKCVRVTSGDRPSGRKKSHHYVGRAADFWIDGLTGGAMMRQLRSSGILSRDFQVIWHGPGKRKCSSGQHIHIGRYDDNRSTCWVYEGTNSNNKCDFTCR